MSASHIPDTNRNTTNTSDLISEREAARILCLSLSCLRSWRYRGCGPRFLKLGGGPKSAVRYRRSDLESFITSSEVRP